MTGYPEHLAQLQFAVLSKLREQAHRAVLQVRERGVGRARTPEAVEVLHWVCGEIHGGEAAHDAGIGEFGDLLRQQAAARVLVALVPAPALLALEILGEAGDAGRVGQVGRAGDEDRAAVVLLRIGIDPRAPVRKPRPVGLLVARLANWGAWINAY